MVNSVKRIQGASCSRLKRGFSGRLLQAPGVADDMDFVHRLRESFTCITFIMFRSETAQIDRVVGLIAALDHHVQYLRDELVFGHIDADGAPCCWL